MFLAKAFLLLRLFLCTVGNAAGEDLGVQTRIQNGSNPTAAEIRNYRSLVSLGFTQAEDGGQAYGVFCGGSLITDQHVLTAAHCIDLYTNFTTYRVAIGCRDSLALPPTPAGCEVFEFNKTQWAKNWIKNPKYNASNAFTYDNAVITLPRKINLTGTAKPTPLAGRRYTKNVNIAGWGVSDCSGTQPREYLIANGTLVNATTCGKAYNKAKVLDNQLCATFTNKDNATSGTDGGDSGSPLFAKTDTGVQVQIGSVSYSTKMTVNGNTCTNTSVPEIFQNVTKSMAFIKKLAPKARFI